MSTHCTFEGCTAPVGKCLLLLKGERDSDDYKSCPHWPSNVSESAGKSDTVSTRNVPWSGLELTPSELHLISSRGTPTIIGLVGPVKAAKTSFIGMLYTLLFNGRNLKDYTFAGSYTLNALEREAADLRFKSYKAKFPDPTSSLPDYYGIYHLALRNHESLKDLLIVDLSGEVFSQWTLNKDHENTPNVRWLYNHASAFVFFVDCELLLTKKAAAYSTITNMAGRLSEGINDRPVIIVWSKADLFDQIGATIRENLREQLLEIFGKNCKELRISNYSEKEPDQYCHLNNLDVINLALGNLYQGIENKIIPSSASTDLFFSYGKLD